MGQVDLVRRCDCNGEGTSADGQGREGEFAAAIHHRRATFDIATDRDSDGVLRDHLEAEKSFDTAFAKIEGFTLPKTFACAIR